MMKRKPYITIAFLAYLLIGSLAGIHAQTTLTLEQCRQRAVQNNKSLLIAGEKHYQAEETRKTALDQFLPKVSVNAGAFWSEKNISLLSEAQQQQLNTMGDAVVGQMVADLGNGLVAHYIGNSSVGQNIANNVNNMGHTITESLQTDTRALYGGAASVTQPIYMGGKIRALYQIAKANEVVEGLKYDKAAEDLQLQVDEAYWRVVSVDHKLQLAQDYYNLLDTLCNNVNEMVEVGVATQGDLLKVQVKRNEAMMSLSKARNGAVLSRMALSQLCGISLDSSFTLADSDPAAFNITLEDTTVNMAKVLASRREIKMLDQAANVAKAESKLAVSTLLPNIVANGGYLVTNPNLQDGYKNSFGGMFYGGIIVNVPLAHPASFHAVNLAKSKQREAALQMSDAQEMIRLQVTQANQKQKEANVRYAQAVSSVRLAEETLRFAQESFAAGLAGASDLLGAQTVWMQAQSEKIDAEIDVRMCKLYFQQVSGK